MRDVKGVVLENGARKLGFLKSGVARRQPARERGATPHREANNYHGTRKNIRACGAILSSTKSYAEAFFRVAAVYNDFRNVSRAFRSASGMFRNA